MTALIRTARGLARQPSYSLLVIAMLALGIAGNSAMFSLLDSLLLRPLAFDDAERLVYLDQTAPDWNLELVSIAYTDFHYWRQGNRSFDSLALVKDAAFNLSADGRAERVRGARVTRDLLDVLRVRPVLGRGFSAEEDSPDGPRAAILSHRLWQDRFGGDREVLGEGIRLDGERYEIVGVLPRALKYPPEADLWVPVAGDAETGHGSYSYKGIGRLLAGVDPAAATRDLDATLESLYEKYPWKRSASSLVRPLRDHYVRDSRTLAWVLMAAVGLVLLIACANVASLMLARGSARGREISVRMALGGSRLRIVGQLLGESFALALAGGALGVALGTLGLRALGAMAADELPFWVSFEPDPRSLAVCVAACVATALVFGLVPAWQTTRVDIQAALASSRARSGAGRGQRRTLSALVVAEMALAQVLLVGAALVLLSQREVLRVDPGFRAENVLTFHVALPESGYPEDADRYGFFRSLVAGLESLPGVESAAAISNLPFQGHNGMFFTAEGTVRGEDASTEVTLTRIATEGYAGTMGLRLLHGRPQRDGGVGEAASHEVLVNESFARYYWGETDVVGRRVNLGDDDDPWLTVVGVAADVKHYGLDEDPRPGVYLPMGYFAWPELTLAVRTAVDPKSIVPAARDLVRSLDPELPLYRVTTMEDEVDRALTLRRLSSWLFGLFALVALALAAGGTYGVVSYGVGQRLREIGIRVALGARGSQVLAGVLRGGLALAAAGAVLGMLGAAALSRSLASLLFGVEARDPAVFAAVAVALVGVALVANAVPAARAARLDAMRVLREE